MKKYPAKLTLFFILLIAFLFRFNNLNWDNNFHLHPDERFLTMVGNSMKTPETIVDYFNPHVSSLNPANIGYKFFVYGVFPLTLNKFIAINLDTDTYNSYTLQGRMLSGFFDVLILITLYHFVFLLEKKYKIDFTLKYWSAFFYAIAVLPIQLSHFFAVDTFLAFFMFSSFFFSFRYYVQRGESNLVLSAILFALAMSTKINSVFILPLNLFFIFLTLITEERKKNFRSIVSRFTIFSLAYGLTSYIVMRCANPYFFESSNFFNPTISSLFIDNLKSLKTLDGDVWFPPAIQWITKPWWFSIKNLALYGVGIPYFLLLVIGAIQIVRTKKTRNFEVVIFSILGWVLVIFIYQSFQFVKALRYFIFLYPFFAFLAAVGYIALKERVKNKGIRTLVGSVIIVLCLVWPVAFSSIYLKPHSRVAASEWIYKNIPSQSVLLTEHWDDGLPLPMPNPEGKTYIFQEMPVFGMDNEEKWQQMNQNMQKGDYYILSSNRGWGSIPTVPKKYPKMGTFYQELFDEKLGYKKVAEFTSYPVLKIFNFKIEFPDDTADETFTVYDHPKVMIFKNEKK